MVLPSQVILQYPKALDKFVRDTIILLRDLLDNHIRRACRMTCVVLTLAHPDPCRPRSTLNFQRTSYSQ